MLVIGVSRGVGTPKSTGEGHHAPKQDPEAAQEGGGFAFEKLKEALHVGNLQGASALPLNISKGHQDQGGGNEQRVDNRQREKGAQD